MSTKIIRLELSEKLWLDPTLHGPHKRKVGLLCFEWRWHLNDMKVPWYCVFSFFFLNLFLFFIDLFIYFLFTNKSKQERILWLLWFFFFNSVISKVIDHSYVQSSFSTITRHLDNGNWKTPYSGRFYRHEST